MFRFSATTAVFVVNASKLFVLRIYYRRGSFLSTTMFVYALSSPVNGYFGGSLYSRMGGMITMMCCVRQKYWL